MNAWMKVAVALAVVVVGASAICGAENTPSAILIRNATILTVSHGTIEKGDVLIKDGKIAAVGTSVKAPADAQVIDAAGQFVTPGIIDCHSHIAVDGSVNEGSVSVSSMVNIADVAEFGRHRDFPRFGGRRNYRECAARFSKRHWRANDGDQAALGPTPRQTAI